MKKSIPGQARASLLHSTEILNSASVSRLLGITERSAGNLLQRWCHEGAVYRTAPGCYMSAYVDRDHERLIIQSLKKRLGANLLFVGASSLKRVGWCSTNVMHVAVPLRPSRWIPKVRNTVIYPVGARLWLQLAKCSVQMDLDRPPILHPVSQMVWWMDRCDSPVEMPSPDKMNWAAIRSEPQVADAMKAHWPDELTGDLDVELLYRMLHMDRLKLEVPGRAEPFHEDPAQSANEHTAC